MNSTTVGSHRSIFLTAAVLCTILGVFRLFDRGNDPYDGYATDGNNMVIRVDADGPAERAGLRVGDHIRSIDGIAVEDAHARFQQGRPRIGQPATLQIERGGAGQSDTPPSALSLSFTHAAPPGDFAARNLAGFLIGLCFMVCSLAACFKVPNRNGRVLALAGLSLGATFLGFPYFSSYSMRLLAQAILSLVLVLGFASLFHFMLEFPKPKSFVRRKYALIVIYGPALFITLFLLFLVVVQPPATGALNWWSNLLLGLFLVAYFGGAAVAMVHSYLRATPAERAHYGLHIELAGVVLGILPVTLDVLFRIFNPTVILPGSDFYFLTVVFIPVALVTVVFRQQRGAGLSVSEA